MQAKKKLCNICQEEKLIWKTVERTRYCKSCWGKSEKKKLINKTITPLRSKSSKLEALEKLYSKLRLEYLDKNPSCQAYLPGCTRIATDIHHKKGRGPFLLDIASWLPVCRKCHTWIELNPEEAKELNLSENRL